MPSPRRGKRPRLALCATLTLDGKLADGPATLPPEPPRGDADPARHPWAGLYAEAAAFLADDRAETMLPATGVVRPVIVLGRTVSGAVPDGWQHELQTRLAALPEPAVRSRTRVLCFGGAVLFRALLVAGWVDELHLVVSPRIDGRRHAPTLSGPPGAEFFPASVACRLQRMEVRGNQCFLRYQVARP